MKEVSILWGCRMGLGFLGVEDGRIGVSGLCRELSMS